MRKVKCGMKNAESYCGMVAKTLNAEMQMTDVFVQRLAHHVTHKRGRSV